VVLLASGLSVATLWTQLELYSDMWVGLLYHLVTVHIALWYAPIYAWLLLVSAWARRTRISLGWSTAVMMGRIAEVVAASQGQDYRCRLFALLSDGSIRRVLHKGLVVDGDAAATANNILAHQPLFRLGLATGLIATACYIAVTALFYGLFKPVNRSLSLLAAFFSLVGCAILAFGSLFQLAPLVVLGGSQYLSVFKVEQLRALALMFLN
jgi:hypothetical protein